MRKILLFVAVIFLTVTALRAQLQFQPATLDFGTQPLTSSNTQEVILISQINQTITLSDLPAPFTASPDEFSISIGEQKIVTITFHPMTVGSFSQTLTATGSIWGTAQLQVYGQAGEATVSFSTYSLDMGTIIMTGHSQQMITLQSDIAQQVTLSNLPSPFGFNPLVVDLLPNEPAQVFVSFDPITPGYFQDYLYATGNISGSAQIIVYGSATEASIFAFPQSVNFDPLFSGQTDTLEMIVTTDINQQVTLSGLSEVFNITPTTLVLTGGNPETVFISFNPVNPGVFNETLLLQGDVWGSLQVPVYGECIDPQISVSPAQVDFGTVALSASSTQYVTISNTGNGTLECILANNNLHFVVSPATMSISQGSSQDVAVIFTPDFIPAEYDTLFIESNDPDNPLVKIPLIGSGMSQVSGEVCGTWYKANSPYNFTGSVTVPETCTLTIEPGVVVNMWDYDFFVNGKLVCNGLENDSIYLNGTGIFQLSASCPNDSIDYVAIDGGSTDEDGLTIKSFGAKIKNTRVKGYQIVNGAMFYDDFETGTWTDNWTRTSTYGNVYQGTDYGFVGKGIAIESVSYSWGCEIISDPIVIPYIGFYNISIWYRITQSYQSRTRFYYQINSGTWNLFHETQQNQTKDWTQLCISIADTVHSGDMISLKFESYNPNYSNGFQITNVDNVSVGKGSVLNLSNTILDIHSLQNYNVCNNSLPNLTISNSSIKLVKNIESYFNNNSIEMYNSIISQAGDNAIRTNGAFSDIILDNVTVENADGNGVYTWANDSKVIVNNSTIRNCTGTGIYTTNSSNSPVTVKNSVIENNSSTGIYAPYQTVIVFGSIISNNKGDGIYANIVDIINSVVSSNYYYGVTASNIYGNYLTSIFNGNKGIIETGTGTSYLFNSIVCLNAQYGSQYSGTFDFSNCKVAGNPKVADSLGHLLLDSPCIDAADPTEEDAHIPYGMGTVRADMGAYGGPENWVWGGNPIPTNGEPDILQIVDLPYDQGKMVGIQYKASLFDNGHSAYDVNRYSFWRELDENGKLPLEASKIPVGQFFQKGTNYWEYVGEMPANGFTNYGYSATTLGDSTVSGMFWSKFLVVAHTDDNDIYWVSQPDSGYSVDNLAPAQPLNLAGTVAGVTYNLQWTPSPDEDFQYYAVYRAEGGIFGEEPFATTTEPEFSDITLNLEEQDFAVAAFDFSGNRSPLSNTLTSPVYDLLEIPAGWSGISSWINPSQPELGFLFAPASTNLIILQNMQGVYWPGQNVNTLGSWDDGAGYMIKMAQEAQIPFIGTKNPDNDFQLTSGWQILPVLTNCPLSVEELQNQLGSNLVMVKEIAGWRVFWPAMGISTLETLEPGRAYFLNTLTGNGQVVFGECE